MVIVKFQKEKKKELVIFFYPLNKLQKKRKGTMIEKKLLIYTKSICIRNFCVTLFFFLRTVISAVEHHRHSNSNGSPMVVVTFQQKSETSFVEGKISIKEAKI